MVVCVGWPLSMVSGAALHLMQIFHPDVADFT